VSFLIQLALCLYLLPATVLAQTTAMVTTTVRDPLNYPLRQYGFILFMSLLGGAVAYYGKVRKGELPRGSLSSLVGELATSAFAGLLAFYVCEWFNLDKIISGCAAGLAGHAGGSGITWAESVARRRAERLLGVGTSPVPLGKE